jgi:hypothetical protein
MPSRRECEESLIAMAHDKLTQDMADALTAAHKREDAIRAIPRFDYRECDSASEFLDADNLDAILDGDA